MIELRMSSRNGILQLIPSSWILIRSSRHTRERRCFRTKEKMHIVPPRIKQWDIRAVKKRHYSSERLHAEKYQKYLASVSDLGRNERSNFKKYQICAQGRQGKPPAVVWKWSLNFLESEIEPLQQTRNSENSLYGRVVVDASFFRFFRDADYARIAWMTSQYLHATACFSMSQMKWISLHQVHFISMELHRHVRFKLLPITYCTCAREHGRTWTRVCQIWGDVECVAIRSLFTVQSRIDVT